MLICFQLAVDTYVPVRVLMRFTLLYDVVTSQNILHYGRHHLLLKASLTLGIVGQIIGMWMSHMTMTKQHKCKVDYST